MNRSIPAVAVFVLTVSLAGCGSPLAAKKYSISGTVSHGGEKMTWPDGGSLLVLFLPEDPSQRERYAAHDTDTANSHYAIKNIPPGRYKVAVQQFYPSAKTSFNDVLNGRYDPGHTDIVVEVTQDGQVIDIDVPKTGNARPERRPGKDKD